MNFLFIGSLSEPEWMVDVTVSRVFPFPIFFFFCERHVFLSNIFFFNNSQSELSFLFFVKLKKNANIGSKD